ncbi:MAG: HPr kinase/phosphorylase [Phyllobacteriaceae bacterium]|nr:HPr kinase/phosphorylase [Phyllobacteriaceae bacterium]
MAANFHATALVLGDRGIMIRGPSGSGKTTLALFLLERAVAGGRFAAMVGDDQVLIERVGDCPVARSPPAIAGLAERRGPGPLPIAAIAAARIDGLVELVEPAAAPRLEDRPTATLEKMTIPCLRLARGDTLASALAVEAWRDNGFAPAS